MMESQYSSYCDGRIKEIAESTPEDSDLAAQFRQLASIMAYAADQENRERLREHEDQSTLEHALGVLETADAGEFTDDVLLYLEDIIRTKKAVIARRIATDRTLADDIPASASNWSRYNGDLRDFDRTEASAINSGMGGI